MKDDWLFLSLLLFCLGVWVVLGNWIGTFQAYRNRKKGSDNHYSQVPLISLLFCICSGLAYPYEPRWWIFIPTALDPGTWVLLCFSVVLIRERPFKKKPKD